MSKSKIKVLPPEVANRIAAGEVVERPVSVVKELVENSLDAGSKKITVSVVSSGKSLIEVSDDGSGLTKEDAELAVQRFGTSKLESETGLESISTLGFRGEALPSIASVSRFKILSASEEGGAFELSSLGGLEQKIRAASRSVGTTVTVESLFFNVPARKAFLRTDQSELSEIKTLLLDLAAANPRVHFVLISEGQVVLDLSPTDSLFSKVDWVGSDLIEVNKEFQIDEAAAVKVEAVLCDPLKTLRSANKLRILVNKRSVRDKTILSAVRAAFGNYLKPGKFPAGYVSVSLPSYFVDVNIHPRKSEVRFSDSSLVFRLVLAALKLSFQTESEPRASRVSAVPSVSNFSSNAAPQERQEVFSNYSPASEYKYLGQVLSCFLIFEKEQQVVLVDMHAAHERVVYNELLKNYYSKKPTVQPFLIPQEIKVGSPIVDKFKEFKSAFADIGFDVEEFSKDSLAVRSVPSALVRVNVEDLFQDLDECFSVKESADDKVEAVLARVACHGSVRSGRELSRNEAYALLDDILELGDDARCPHGRPVTKNLERDELYKMFGRL